MYEPSRHLATYFIAGFQHWDGALALNSLNAGKSLDLVSEPDNPYDAKAIAIYSEGLKIGYIPTTENELIATLMYFGHTDAFELRVLQVDYEAEPWKQVRVGLYVSDAR